MSGDPIGVRSSSRRRFLLCLVLFSALHVLLWTVLVPPGHGVDEEAHFAYVEFLALNRYVPVMHHEFRMTKNWRWAIELNGFSRVRLQTLEKPIFPDEPQPYPVDAFTEGTYFSGSPGGPPLHYLLLAPIYLVLMNASIFAKLYAVRLVGVLLAIVTSYFSFRALEQIEGDTPTVRVMALCVAAHPMGGFLQGIVSTDAAMIAYMAVASFVLVRMLRQEPTSALTALWAFFCGAGFLIKPFSLSCAALFACVVIVRSWSQGLPRVVRHIAIFVLVYGLVIAPWVIWAKYHYGGLTGFSLAHPTEPLGIARIFEAYWAIAQPQSLFSQGLGIFGWLDAPLPFGVRASIGLLFVVGWALFLVASCRGRIDRKWMVLAALALMHALAIVGAALWTMHATGYRLGVQGRYFLYPLAAWIAPSVLGWFHAGGQRRWILAAVGVAALALAFFSLGHVLIPRYYL